MNHNLGHVIIFMSPLNFVQIHYPLSETATLTYDAVTSSLPASSVAHGSVITMNNITYEGKIAADSRIVL
ncbi:hypothetical protein OROMI_002706 [Orobanche minor]